MLIVSIVRERIDNPSSFEASCLPHDASRKQNIGIEGVCRGDIWDDYDRSSMVGRGLWLDSHSKRVVAMKGINGAHGVDFAVDNAGFS